MQLGLYLRSNKLYLSGDSCCDSPGHRAKHGMYSFIDSALDFILDYSLVQVTETSSSVGMEKKGLRCFDKGSRC